MNILAKTRFLFFTLPVVFLHGCKDEANMEPSGALDAHVIFLNSGFEADLDTLQTDSTLTVIDNENVTEVFPIRQSNKISLDVVSPNSNVIAVGLRFGSGGIIHFSSEPDVYFALSGNICDDLAPVCHYLTIYEYGLTSEGKISLPKEQDAVIICGNCCSSAKEQPVAGKPGNPSFNLTFSKGAEMHLYVDGPPQDSTGTKDVSWTCLDCDIGANENVYWENGPSGEYKFRVKYEGSCVADVDARFMVTVTDGGKTVETYSGSLSPGEQTGPDPWIYNKQ